MKPLRFLLIGNPENRRAQFFERAAQSQQCDVRVIAWSDVLTNSADWLTPHIVRAQFVRIESPGENSTVERLLVERGAALENLGPDKIEFPKRRGRILNSRLWFLGLRDVMREFASRYPFAIWLNHPDDIVTMFDKPNCQEKLCAAGIPVPQSLGFIFSYDHLKEQMAAERIGRVFVKPSFGSSASGVIALQMGRDRVFARTSVELVRQGGQVQLFNSLRVREYDQENDIATIVDTLAADGIYAEQWLPKSGFDGRTVDLRIVVIRGRRMHTVLRSSRHPMTNLHLGNARGDVQRFWQTIPHETQMEIQKTCARVESVIPRSLYAGVDLMLSPGLKRHAILELNAFGDLLPNLLIDGQDTYSAEVSACLS